jgi:transcriptional regulator with XRE-family HTH domain
MSTNLDFPEWLEGELRDRQMSSAELSRRSGVQKSTLSRILNREHKPMPVTLEAIAAGLKIPPAVVFRAAGYLPKAPEDGGGELLSFLLSRLTEDNKGELINYAEYLVEKQERATIRPLVQAKLEQS